MIKLKKIAFLLLLVTASNVMAIDGDFIYESKARLDFVKSKVQAKDPYYLSAYNDIISKANAALSASANPVVDKTQTPPSGDKHDYLSLAPYWWPDPNKANGLPWIKKDGQVNPLTRGDNTDQVRLSKLFNNVDLLAFAYYLSGDVKYADKAKSLIKIWFIDEATLMNPNINFGQGVPGRDTGREYGVIEFTGINAVITALQIFEQDGLLNAGYVDTMKKWFTDYVNWLTTNSLGIAEGNTKNNHAVWYDHQVVGIQLYVGKIAEATARLNAFKTRRINKQIETNGRMPQELSRTKSVNYTSMCLRAFILVAEMGNKVGVDLLNYESADGRGIKKALAFLKPYVEGTKTWTWEQINGGGATKAIDDIMKPQLFGVAKSIYKLDFVEPSLNVHVNMGSMYRIQYPYNFEVNTSRTLNFKNIQSGQELERHANLTIEANVGSAFKEVSLWLGDTNLGTLTSAPFTWSGHALLTNMIEPSYTFKLVAKDSSNVEVEEVVSVTLGEPEPVVSVDSLIRNLIFYCPLNKDGRDLSGNENNAIPGNAVTFAPGKFGNAAVFSYTEGSYITTADSVFKYSYPTAYTIAFWLKVSDYSKRGDILQPTVGRTLLYSLGDLSFRCSHQKKVISFRADEQEKNDWLHVAILLDQRDGQKKHQVFINGEQRGDIAEGYEFETDKPQSIGKLIFGAFSADELMRNFTGMIDEIYMFNDVLSDDEISFLMNTGNLVALSNLNQSSLYINFEDGSADNWVTDGADYGVTPTITDGSTVRSGSKVMTFEYFSGTSGHHVQNTVDKIVVPDQSYFHAISYSATSRAGIGMTFPTAKLGDWAPTPSFTSHEVENVYERKTTSRQNTTGGPLDCYPRLRSKAQGGACVIYYDDFVLYADTSSEVDLVAPAPAKNFKLDAVSSSSNQFSWTEGIDDETGVQMTYILRTSTPLSAEEPEIPTAPVLLPQVGYSVVGGFAGPNIVDDWAVIAALGAGTTSYTDVNVADGVVYTYAIVHRDLAYNYSEALLSRENGGTATNKVSVVNFNYYTNNYGIQLNSLTLGENIDVYNMSGMKVFSQKITNSALSIPLPKGIYIVRVTDNIVKVAVK